MQDSIIEAIYDAPTASRPWHNALRQLRQATGASSVLLKLTPDRGPARSQLLADSAWDHRLSFAEYRREYQFRDPVLYRPLEPGRCYDFQDIASPGEMQRSDYFTNFCQRFGIGHAFYLYLGHHEGHDVMFAGARAPDAGPFSDDQLQRLRAIYPHLARAVRTHCRIQPLATGHWAMSQGHDRAGLASVLLDAGGEIIAASDAAQPFLGAGGIVSEIARKLVNVGDARGITERLPALHGGMVQMIAEAVPTDSPAAIMGGAWQILLQDEHVLQQPLDGEKLASLFGLTSAEARFASALLAHDDIAKAGEVCSLTLESARTYRKRIMAKVGVSTQTALFLLLGRSLARIH